MEPLLVLGLPQSAAVHNIKVRAGRRGTGRLREGSSQLALALLTFTQTHPGHQHVAMQTVSPEGLWLL